MKPCEQLWRRVDSIDARGAVASIVSAGRAQGEYLRASNASKRARILVGKSAGQEYQLRAETEYRKRNEQLRYAKQQVAQLIESATERQKKHFEEFLGRDGLREFAGYTRQTAVVRLLDADISADEAQRAVTQLDSTLKTLEGLKSLDDASGYLQRHLDELIEKKAGNPDPNPWCMLMLILTSMIAIVIMIAVIICVFTFGFACDEILDAMLLEICPPL